MGEGDTLMNALVGAVVTVVLSVTGFSPLLGGLVAGYLQRGDGVRVGAISGAIATIPFLLVFPLFFGFIFAGPAMGPGMGGMGDGMGVPRLTGAFFVFAFVFALLWNVVLSAAGGYLGVYVARETGVGQ